MTNANCDLLLGQMNYLCKMLEHNAISETPKNFITVENAL